MTEQASDNDMVRVSINLRRRTYNAIRNEIDGRASFAALVRELLYDWLDRREAFHRAVSSGDVATLAKGAR